MRPAIWSQADMADIEAREVVGLEAGIKCTAEEDKARQEFKDEADINVLLRRYGAVPPPKPLGGEWDFDQDFQAGLNATRELAEGYAKLPRQLREAYPEPLDLIAAVLRGEVQYKGDGTPEVPSGGSAPSPSDSAAAPDKA